MMESTQDHMGLEGRTQSGGRHNQKLIELLEERKGKHPHEGVIKIGNHKSII